MAFDRACFWLQVHDLPLGSLNMRVTKEIVSAAGEVVHSEESSDEYEGSNFVRVRMSLDITKPLSRGRKIGLSNREESWVSFKYKRLPNLCYWCGRLTHQDWKCSLWQRRKGTPREGDQQFGSWLHAATPNLAKKTNIRVTGYEEEASEEPACNPSPRSNGDGRWFKPQTETGSEGEDEQRFQSAMGDQVVQELTPEARTEEEKGPAELCTTACLNINQLVSASFHNFQDQFNEIDGELTWYDDNMAEDTEGELVVQQCGVGS